MWEAVVREDGKRALRRVNGRSSKIGVIASNEAIKSMPSHCRACGEVIRLKSYTVDFLCEPCRQKEIGALTVYDRERKIGAIPANLIAQYGPAIAA